jgi:anti-sigma regulatory factor (Ser/Thr protein kinase)
MTPADHASVAPSCDHVAKFYDDADELVAAVSPRLSAALHDGAAVIAIVGAEHAGALRDALAREGVDVDAALAEGRLAWLDAAETLAAMTADGAVAPERFATVVGGVVRRAATGGRPVVAFGEMVALLWDAGDVLGAVALEQLWEGLRTEIDFELICGYRASGIADPGHAGALRQVCEAHTVVVPASSGAPVTPLPAAVLDAQLPATLDAVGRARRMVAARLREWGVTGAALYDAALVTSELAANAVRHAGSPFTLHVWTDGAVVHISVRDGAELPDGGADVLPTRPAHGLGLVASLARRWGRTPLTGGKTVWAELSV